MHLFRVCKAANYPHKVLKIFDDSTLLAKHTLVRRSGISESASADYPHLSSSRHNLTVSALRRVLQLTNYIIRTATLAQRVTAAGQLDVELHGYTTPTRRINMIPSIHGGSGSSHI